MAADSSGKISLALGSRKKPTKPTPTNGVKRTHAALQDNEDNDPDHSKAQSVSHFDKSAGGAIDEANLAARGPQVIAPQANRDWKEASQRNKRQKSGVAQFDVEAQRKRAREVDEREAAKKPGFGLNVKERKQDDGQVGVEERGEREEAVSAEPLAAKPRTDDELAMDALMGNKQKSDRVVPAMSEEQAFDRDVRDAPEMATLDEYARMPVDDFGAALLRGMGWKDGEGIGSDRGKKSQKTKIPERRPALLGIGAKEEAAVAQELGTWGKAAKDKKRGPPPVYNPVLLRDKNTGEMFTEQELEEKKKRDERQKYEAEFEESERRKEKERRPKDRDASRDRANGHREKDRKRDHRDDRDRRRRDDSDEEYYRRKEKDRRRRRERDREDEEYERERSRRHRNDGERHGDRHRDHRR